LKRVVIFGIIFAVLIIVLVVYLNLSRRAETDRLVLWGIAEAEEQQLSFLIAGRIMTINYDEGDVIDSGAVVAELVRDELAAAVYQARQNGNAARASITSLQVSLATIDRNLEKIKALLPAGAATQTQLDDLTDQKRQTEAQLAHARDLLKVAEAAVDMANVRLGYATLISPLHGTVLARLFDPGEVVLASAPVVTVANLNDLKVKVYLPETQLGRVRLGQKAQIKIDAYPDSSFEGTVTYISDKAEFTPKNVQTREERVKQVFEIEVSTASHGGVLKPGLPCDVILMLQDHDSR